MFAFQAVDVIEDIDTLQATLSPVDDLCLTELTGSSVEELLLNDLSAAESNYTLTPMPHGLSGVSGKHSLTKALTDEILTSSYSGLQLPASVDVDGLLSNAPLEDIQSFLHVTKLSSDVMLADDQHSLMMPEATSVDLDGLDSLHFEGTQPSLPCDLDTDDFVLDEADWSSVQVFIEIVWIVYSYTDSFSSAH